MRGFNGPAPTLRLALLDEGPNAFMGISLKQIVGHDLRHVGIGLGHGHVSLRGQRPVCRS